jgi:hypothetical protein
MSKVQKDLEDVSSGTGQINKKSDIYIYFWVRNLRQSWQGQLWPHPVELGLSVA